jgi:hypothetical protein
MLKAWKLFGDEDCHRMWEQSVAALNQYVADTVTTSHDSVTTSVTNKKDNTPNHVYLWYGEANMNTGARTGTQYGALAAFFAGSLALSGDTDRARRLQDSNYKMWTLTGIEPEEIDYSTMKTLSPGYQLRPENIESAYYLYYFTHDPKYREMGLTYFNSIVQYCRTPSAFAALSNVETKTQRDDMESFFFAETMKYLYLLLADPNHIDLEKTVFNTEAHPLNKLSS